MISSKEQFKYIYGPVYSWRLGMSLGIGPTVRASFAFYNTQTEIDQMVEILKTLVGCI